jgi:sulfatase modifying factor 1
MVREELPMANSTRVVLGGWGWLVSGLVLSGSLAAGGVVYEVLPIGDPNNVADATSFGAVSYEYYIGKYEVTIGQYAEFLNKVAKADPNGLYNTQMGTNGLTWGIERTGVSGSYVYTPRTPQGTNPIGADSPTERPISYVGLFDTMRFANWMANGQPTGAQSTTTTENGAYNLAGATATNIPGKNFTNPNTLLAPTFWIPTENEWYKAAYYDPNKFNPETGAFDGYWNYATMSDDPPDNFDLSGFFPNQANVRRNLVYTVSQSTAGPTTNVLTDVGVFASTFSYYGAFDMTGNVREWSLPGGATGRVARGGDYNTNNVANMGSGVRFTPGAAVEEAITGFRLSSNIATVPEPSTWLLAAGGLAGLGAYRAARRRRGVRSAGPTAPLLP